MKMNNKYDKLFNQRKKLSGGKESLDEISSVYIKFV